MNTSYATHDDVIEALRTTWPTKAERQARALAVARPNRLQFTRRKIRNMHRQELHAEGRLHQRTTEPGKPTEWLLSERLVAKQKAFRRLVRQGTPEAVALMQVFGIDVVASEKKAA